MKKLKFWSREAAAILNFVPKIRFTLMGLMGIFSNANSNLSEATDEISALHYFVWGCTHFFSNSTVLDAIIPLQKE